MGNLQIRMGCESSNPSKDVIRVEYFDAGYARADCIRFLLHHAHVDYKYVGYDFGTWPKVKAIDPPEFGGLPRVTVNGKEWGQALAILRALGTKYGYYNPKDWKSAYYCDVVLECFVDIHDQTNGLTLADPMGQSTGKED